MTRLEATNQGEIPRVEEWKNTDSRVLSFEVTQDGEPRDITGDTVTWELYLKPYNRPGVTPLLSDSEPDVNLVTSGAGVDGTAGEFEVQVSEGGVSDLWGKVYQQVVVDPPDSSRQTFIGEVWLTDTPESDTGDDVITTL